MLGPDVYVSARSVIVHRSFQRPDVEDIAAQIERVERATSRDSLSPDDAGMYDRLQSVKASIQRIRDASSPDDLAAEDKQVFDTITEVNDLLRRVEVSLHNTFRPGPDSIQHIMMNRMSEDPSLEEAIHSVTPSGVNATNVRDAENVLRRAYSRGELTDSVIARVESIPGWTWRPFRDTSKWDIQYNVLRDYVEEHAGLPRYRTRHLGAAIGEWMSRQRSAYKKGLLSHDRIHKLESVPEWSWSSDPGGWMSTVQLLQDYVLEYGRLPDRRI